MTTSPFDQKKIENFFQSISAWECAYKSNTVFSYLALKQGEKFYLVQALLSFGTGAVANRSEFASENVRAARYDLSELGVAPRDFLEMLLSGTLRLPMGPVEFLPSSNGAHSISYSEFHPLALQSQNRVNVLTISGVNQTQYLQQPQFDWELRSADRPYDSVQELMFDYGLGQFRGENCFVEVLAFNVAAVELASEVKGDRAKPAIRLATGLDRSRSALSYRVFETAKGVVARSKSSGDKMQWTQEKQFQRGVFEVAIPQGAVLHCVAIYDGVAQNAGWISDPQTFQNARRSVYEAFDPKLDTLRDIIGKTQGRGLESRDLESAVAWLLWMLGFSVAHLGGTRGTQEAIDLIAVTPAGNFAVIECTTGLLKSENKLPLLYDRAQATRRALEASGSRHLTILPVIVTSKTREEVRPDLDQAEKLGILVLTREDLESAIGRTVVFPNADDLFEQAMQSVRAAQAKFEIEASPQLPL